MLRRIVTSAHLLVMGERDLHLTDCHPCKRVEFHWPNLASAAGDCSALFPEHLR